LFLLRGPYATLKNLYIIYNTIQYNLGSRHSILLKKTSSVFSDHRQKSFTNPEGQNTDLAYGEWSKHSADNSFQPPGFWSNGTINCLN